MRVFAAKKTYMCVDILKNAAARVVAIIYIYIYIYG